MSRIRIIAALLLTGAAYPSCAQSLRKLAPDYVNVQHAGSIGWMSVGTGYEFFQQRLRTGLQYGFVPPQQGGRLHILTASVFLSPTRIRLGSKWSLKPVDVGFKGSYQFGKSYFFDLPSRYPPNYYWWKPALRLHLATESSVSVKLSGNSKLRSLSAYMELNTNDLYLVSYVLNFRSLSITEVVKAGIGVRLHFN